MRCSRPPRTLWVQGSASRSRSLPTAASPAAHAACIGHVSPEAAEGGLIGLLKDGDRIRIDIPGRKLETLIDEAEIASPPCAAPEWQPRSLSGWLRRYSLMVGNASSGASLL